MARMTQNFLYTHYTGTAAAQLGTNVGLLHSVVVGGTATGSVQLVDKNANVLYGTIATLNTGSTGSYIFDCVFNGGLNITMPANALATGPDVTVCWTLGN